MKKLLLIVMAIILFLEITSCENKEIIYVYTFNEYTSGILFQGNLENSKLYLEKSESLPDCLNVKLKDENLVVEITESQKEEWNLYADLLIEDLETYFTKEGKKYELMISDDYREMTVKMETIYIEWDIRRALVFKQILSNPNDYKWELKVNIYNLNNDELICSGTMHEDGTIEGDLNYSSEDWE